MSTPTTDDVAQTLAEYERLAIETGARVQIDPPEFWSGLSVDEWAPYWLGTTSPAMIRATVHRDGVPTTVYVSWDESLPAEESWRELWQRKPMKLAGAYAARAALRRAFRDAIGQRREPDEIDHAPTSTATAPAADAETYEAAIAAVSTLDELDALHRKMKGARAVTVPLDRALRARRRELTDAAWEAPTASAAQEPESATAEASAAPAPERAKAKRRTRKPRPPREERVQTGTSVEAAMREALARRDGEQR
ncbi:hypothetical protein QWJ90_01455 [Microbacterium oryzae]|uniref:hypothetical protein n=1 Tax=Microbacterium oryzae TaxID=743009 RepID=UPI0025B28075|nr:hypothetical protein [Microbacterium oryzae]MDN3309589.1 hypothetical protein [Microbacterium oryzae]